jgi:hypothetical protein
MVSEKCWLGFDSVDLVLLSAIISFRGDTETLLQRNPKQFRRAYKRYVRSHGNRKLLFYSLCAYNIFRIRVAVYRGRWQKRTTNSIFIFSKRIFTAH